MNIRRIFCFRLLWAIVLPLTWCFIIFFSVRLLPWKGTEKAWLKICAFRLEHVYMVLSDYKNEYGGYPETSNELLQRMPRNEIPVYFFGCPPIIARTSQAYQYIPESDIEYQGKTPLVWDQMDAHRRLGVGNVLFTDGSVETLEGKDWQRFLEKIEAADIAPHIFSSKTRGRD